VRLLFEFHFGTKLTGIRRTPDSGFLANPGMRLSFRVEKQRDALATDPSLQHLEPVNDEHVDLAGRWLQLQAELVGDALDEGTE